MLNKRERLEGLLLGGAVGDALGLPVEGLSPARQRKWWPGDLQHRLVLGRGMISDDTEHAFMTAQALLKADGDVERFRRFLAWQLRWWFVALPAGVGFATARACLRLWLGISPERSGVNSAGNGPAMRSAIIGAVFAHDPDRRRQFVRASTRLTHLDPRAETAALAVAEAAAWILADNPSEGFQLQLSGLGAGNEWQELCQVLAAAMASGNSVEEFAKSRCPRDGVSGYAYHTVPVVLHAWLQHRGDFRGTITAAIRCGGDTDTVAAIAGALAGCDVARKGIPGDWLDGLRDWPRSVTLLETVASRLAEGSRKPVRWYWPAVIPRNLFFLAIVLLHGFRRLLPPY